MDNSTPVPGVWSLVKWPALITLVVSILRLVGELAGWNETLFGTPGAGAVSVIGIVWLVPVFGFWFGWRLQRTNMGTRRLAFSMLLYVAAIVGAVVAIVVLSGANVIVFPDDKNPDVEPGGFEYMAIVTGAAVLIALYAWPRQTWTLLVYAVLARLPVIAITWVAALVGWETHYTAMPKGTEPLEGAPLALALTTSQIILWIPFTVLVGGLVGCLGALLSGKGSVGGD